VGNGGTGNDNGSKAARCRLSLLFVVNPREPSRRRCDGEL
jgi:hypothetical protein